MSLALTKITSGAYSGSGQLVVTCDMPDNTLILIYRGTWKIGEATLLSGTATIPVLQLATGDIVQASVTERGNQAGIPVRVQDTADRPTGWRTPQTVQVPNADGTLSTLSAAEYETKYGAKPAASYDPSLRVDIVAPDPDSVVAPVATRQPILFDVRIEQQSGSTLVSVQNVLNQLGAVLVRWSSAEAFGNALTRSFTQNATVTVDVKGENDATPVTRTFSVSVFNPPANTPAASDILGFSYRKAVDIVWADVNSFKGTECRLEGYDANWKASEFHEVDYQECAFYPVPVGNYKLWVRLAGDTNADRWKSISIKVQ